METNKRTTGEWFVMDNHPVFEGKNIIVVKDDGNSNSFRNKYKMICEMTEIRGDSFTDVTSEQQANADHIVTACNGYDALLEENKRLKEALTQVFSEISSHIRYKDNGIGWLETAKETIKSALQHSAVKEVGSNEKG